MRLQETGWRCSFVGLMHSSFCAVQKRKPQRASRARDTEFGVGRCPRTPCEHAAGVCHFRSSTCQGRGARYPAPNDKPNLWGYPGTSTIMIMHLEYRPSPVQAIQAHLDAPIHRKGREHESRHSGLFVRSWPFLTFLFSRLPHRRPLRSFPSPRLSFRVVVHSSARWASRSLLFILPVAHSSNPLIHSLTLLFGAAVICFGFRSLRRISNLHLIRVSFGNLGRNCYSVTDASNLSQAPTREDRRSPAIRDSVVVSGLETDLPISR